MNTYIVFFALLKKIIYHINASFTQKRTIIMAFGVNNSNITRQVITTLDDNGRDVMGLNILAWKYPKTSFVSGSLLTVESSHFCALKSRGAILNIYEMGQFPIETPDKPLLGIFQKQFFGGGTDANPWQMEAIYIQKSKLKVSNKGLATSKEMAEIEYMVDYYIHIDSVTDVENLLMHLPFPGDNIDVNEVASYAGPVIEQAINQIVQVTKMQEINERIHDITELCKSHASEFLKIFGITLNDLKISIFPRDQRMRELISLQAIGLTPMDSIRYYLALKMAEQGLISAPNAAVGEGFKIGGALGTWNASGLTDIASKN